MANIPLGLLISKPSNAFKEEKVQGALVLRRKKQTCFIQSLKKTCECILQVYLSRSHSMRPHNRNAANRCIKAFQCTTMCIEAGQGRAVFQGNLGMVHCTMEIFIGPLSLRGSDNPSGATKNLIPFHYTGCEIGSLIMGHNHRIIDITSFFPKGSGSFFSVDTQPGFSTQSTTRPFAFP